MLDQWREDFSQLAVQGQRREDEREGPEAVQPTRREGVKVQRRLLATAVATPVPDDDVHHGNTRRHSLWFYLLQDLCDILAEGVKDLRSI